jgi:signal peptidase
MNDTIARLGRIAVVALLLGAVVTITVLAVPSLIGAEESYVVLSGSMEPELQTGDVVVVHSVSPAEVQEGDIITFRRNGGGDAGDDRVTHRVIEKRTTDDGVVYRTKGDANEEPDPTPVSHSQVIGEVWFHIPLVGRLLFFIKRPLVQGLLIAVPGFLLIVDGLLTFYRAATAE